MGRRVVGLHVGPSQYWNLPETIAARPWTLAVSRNPIATSHRENPRIVVVMVVSFRRRSLSAIHLG
jgi:hypothetical protein